jgi:hypothetical protein
MRDDYFLDLKTLSIKSCLSVRTLRNLLANPERPLPAFHVGGKLLVRWEEFCEWMENFRRKPRQIEDRFNNIVEELTRDVY